MQKREAIKFELREIDAWHNDEDGWWWNESYHIGFFYCSGDEKRAFLRALAKKRIKFKRGTIRVVDDGTILEIQRRKDGEPYYAAIPER